jgi:hypothetical protein
MKVVINDCIGGFSLSELAYTEIGITWDGYGYLDFDEGRDNPKLVAAVEKLGPMACGEHCTKLKVIEIPDDIDWEVCESEEGYEWVQEKTRKWH